MLDKIEVDKVTIEFNRDMYNSSFYTTETASDLYYLKSIKLKYNHAQLVKDITFSYKPKERYFFLDTLKLNNQNPNKQIYKFDYNLDRTLPSPQTISIDHWGFWNGSYSTGENPESYFSNIDSRKAVSTSVFNTGLLKKITYPSGGTTEIEYEYNRYRYYKVRDSQIIHLQDFIASTDIPCGGARVKLIKDYEPVSNKITNERSFHYKNPNNSIESGTIATIPKYKTLDMIQTRESYTETVWNGSIPSNIFCTRVVDATYNTMSSNTIGNENNISEYHIGYQDVVEKFMDNSYIHYHFSSLWDVPDDENVNTHLQESYNVGPFITSRLLTKAAYAEKFGLYKTNDMSKYRGRLLNKATYSSSNVKVEEEKYTYNLAEAKDAFAVTVTSLEAGQIANKIFTTPCRIIRHETIKSNVSDVKTYKYNDWNLISEEEFKNSKGEEFLKKSKYVSNYTLYPENVYPENNLLKAMRGRYMIGYLSEEQILIKKDGNWNLINGTFIKYGFFNGYNIIKPKEEYILETNQPLANYTTSAMITPWDLNFDSHYKKRIVYNNYDIYGNLTYVSKDDASNTVYLWSYKSQYPIAEIKNASYSDVTNVIPETALNAIAGKEEPTDSDWNTISGLRTSLPNALITIYKYKPLAGMKEMIDPRGVVTTYEYDFSGRLQTIKDHNGSKLEVYDYHYKTP
jgi:YD repeat-containing protein